jgi:hypothetical protein
LELFFPSGTIIKPEEFSASTNADALLACQPVAITRPWMEAQVTTMKSLSFGSFGREKPMAKPWIQWIGLRENLQETMVFTCF